MVLLEHTIVGDLDIIIGIVHHIQKRRLCASQVTNRITIAHLWFSRVWPSLPFPALLFGVCQYRFRRLARVILSDSVVIFTNYDPKVWISSQYCSCAEEIGVFVGFRLRDDVQLVLVIIECLALMMLGLLGRNKYTGLLLLPMEFWTK